MKGTAQRMGLNSVRDAITNSGMVSIVLDTSETKACNDPLLVILLVDNPSDARVYRADDLWKTNAKQELTIQAFPSNQRPTTR